MRICVIGKYPPIEGGVSAETYWMCRALAERGHDVVVVTNAAEVDDDYRMEMSLQDIGELNRQFANGGRLRVSWTSPWSERDWHHVPTGNPIHTRLVSLALQVVAEQKTQLILSHYLEPYGLAASMVGSFTGVPWVVRHAGSDRFRLIKNAELGGAYKATLRHADGVMFSGSDLLGLGVEPERVIGMPARNFVPPSFSDTTPPMDLVAAFDSEIARSTNRFICPGPLRADKPIVGMYGKVGEEKGTFDLLRAYAASPFLQDTTQLVLLGGGANLPLLRETISKLGLSDRVWLHPFVAHWQVAAYLRSCRAVCLLERSFDVTQHGPGLLKEALACAVPTVVSAEVFAKNLPGLDERQVKELVRVIPAGSEAEDLASALKATLENHASAPAAPDGTTLTDRAQVSRDFDVLSDELVRRFSAGTRSADEGPPGRNRERVIRPIMEMIGSVAPMLVGRFREELEVQLAMKVAGLDERLPTMAAVLPVVEAIVARATDTAHELSPSVSVHESSVMRLEADLLWGALDLSDSSEAFPSDVSHISRMAIQAPSFDRHRDSFRRCWARSNRLRFRELSVSILDYLEDRRNTVDLVTRESHSHGGESKPRSSVETRSFLIAQRADLDPLVIQVSRAVSLLVNYCDGASTAEEIATKLREHHPLVSNSVVVDWLHSLQEQDVVRETWTYEPWRETAPYLTREIDFSGRNI